MKKTLHIAVMVREPGGPYDSSMPISVEFDSLLPSEVICRAVYDAVKLTAEGFIEALDETANRVPNQPKGEA